MPGAGWQPIEDTKIPVAVPGRDAPIVINKYVIAHGDEQNVVLYWYQSHNRVIAGEFSAKFWLVADAIRYSAVTPLSCASRPGSGDRERGGKHRRQLRARRLSRRHPPVSELALHRWHRGSEDLLKPAEPSAMCKTSFERARAVRAAQRAGSEFLTAPLSSSSQRRAGEALFSVGLQTGPPGSRRNSGTERLLRTRRRKNGTTGSPARVCL